MTEKSVVAGVDVLFAELGMNISTAFNIFVCQSLLEGGLPFDVTLNQPVFMNLKLNQNIIPFPYRLSLLLISKKQQLTLL